MKNISVFFILIAGFISLKSTGQEYNITFEFQDIKDTNIRIMHRFGDKTYIDDTIQVSENGKAKFKGDEKLPGGIYIAAISQNNYFEFLVGDDKTFTLKTNAENPVKNMQVTGDTENSLFFESQNYLRKNREKVKNYQDSLKQVEDGSKIAEELNGKIDSIKKHLQQSWRDIVKNNPNTFYATLLKAQNGKEGEFYDNVDFSDPRLLRTNIIYSTIRANMARDLNAHKPPKVIIRHTDKMLEKAKANDEVFKYALMHHLKFYRDFKRLGMNKVYVHLADKYVASGEADWLDSSAVKEIMKLADKWRSSFTGNKASDIECVTPSGELFSLHDVPADYTILFFWKTGCEHCKKAAKILRDFYENNESDIEIYSVFTKNNKEQWVNYLDTHNLNGWINVYDPENESNFRNLFYVVSTPLMYLLDENKKIIAKRAGDESIKQLLEELKRQKK